MHGGMGNRGQLGHLLPSLHMVSLTRHCVVLALASRLASGTPGCARMSALPFAPPPTGVFKTLRVASLAFIHTWRSSHALTCSWQFTTDVCLQAMPGSGASRVVGTTFSQMAASHAMALAPLTVCSAMPRMAACAMPLLSAPRLLTCGSLGPSALGLRLAQTQIPSCGRSYQVVLPTVFKSTLPMFPWLRKSAGAVRLLVLKPILDYTSRLLMLSPCFAQANCCSFDCLLRPGELLQF